MNKSKERYEVQQVLASNDFLPHNHPLFWHGRIFQNKDASLLQPPQMTWESPHKPRDDHDNNLDWLTASEFEDDENMMDLKLRKLAQLLILSKKTVVYSGAGISVAAGIGQASRGSKRQGHPHLLISPTSAMPTKTHYALCKLANNGLIHGWVQQNHDGLPQKAGFPQERINEIHGSWYNPSNPVVLYSGCLRSHESTWMRQEANTADLVLVLGTSLSGLNADKVAIKTAMRSLRKQALGMVIVNLQQTPHDGKASLRMFGSSDDVFQSLLSYLGNISMPPMQPKMFPHVAAAAASEKGERKFLVPYDARGILAGKEKLMCLDLTVGAKIKIVNHNIAGAGQPSHQPMIAHCKDPIGQVVGWDDDKMAVKISMQPQRKVMLLGYWWIEAAIHGRTPTIPLVNV